MPKDRGGLLQEMTPLLGRIPDILEGESVGGARMLTPFGVLAPPLGLTRLKAVEVVAALTFTGLPQADAGKPAENSEAHVSRALDTTAITSWT